MKMGMRKPSPKKSFKARTTGNLKRKAKKSINPLYGKKGMGLINDPKKALYNKAYNKTTFSVNDIVGNGKNKEFNILEIAANSTSLQNELGISTKAKSTPGKFILSSIAFIFLGMFMPPLVLLGLILDIMGLISLCKRKYWIAYRWDRALAMYINNNYTESRRHLDKLPASQKETDAYKKMLLLLNEDNENITNDIILNSDKKFSTKEVKITYSNQVFNEFIVVDLETTGLDCITDKIIEISALKYRNGEIVDRFETLINPQIHISSRITAINNINDKMVKDKPITSEVLPDFLNFIEYLPLVAHNASFDIKFLNANLAMIDQSITNKVIDTLKISRKIYTNLSNHKLETIKKHLEIDVESHRASADCIVAAQIYMDYCNLMNEKSIDANSIEIEVYNKVKSILEKNNRDLTYIRLRHVGVYTDICAFYTLLRLKLNGKKQYILSNIDNIELENYGFELDEPSKSENYKNRIKFTSIDIIDYLEDYIIKEFDNCIKSMEHYRDNTTVGQKNIYDYLLNL